MRITNKLYVTTPEESTHLLESDFDIIHQKIEQMGYRVVGFKNNLGENSDLGSDSTYLGTNNWIHYIYISHFILMDSHHVITEISFTDLLIDIDKNHADRMAIEKSKVYYFSEICKYKFDPFVRANTSAPDFQERIREEIFNTEDGKTEVLRLFSEDTVPACAWKHISKVAEKMFGLKNA
jgi:hypothetical protein